MNMLLLLDLLLLFLLLLASCDWLVLCLWLNLVCSLFRAYGVKVYLDKACPMCSFSCWSVGPLVQTTIAPCAIVL